MAGARDNAQHTRQAWIMRDSRRRRDRAHEGIYDGGGGIVSGIDYGVVCVVAWGQRGNTTFNNGRQRPALSNPKA